MIGECLGPYEIEAEIGRGGMGYVYRAVQPSLGRTVAVKTLLPHLVADEEFIERFLREARATAKLSHPGIVTIHDVGEQDGIYYFAMEYLSGRTLDDIVRSEGEMAPETAVNYVRQIAAALAHAHAVGILHRDVKPSNVMVDDDNRAVLTDFGIARALNDSRLTRTGTAVGSPDYMSPEQVEGGRQDQRSDLYALGILFYQLLTGQTPYHGETPLAVAFQHVNGPVRSPREANPRVPAQIDAVVRKLLAKKPDDRYDSAGALLAALDSQPAVGTTTSPVAPTIALPVRQKDRSYTGVIVALVVVLGAGLAYGGYEYFGSRAAPPPAAGGDIASAVTAIPQIDVPAEPEPVAVRTEQASPAGLPAEAPPRLPAREVDSIGQDAAAGPEDDPSVGAVMVSAEEDRPEVSAPTRAPAPTRPPAPVPEAFAVTSRPEGAVVTLDGVRVAGVTPLNVDLLAGESYRIGVELDGYESTGFEFNLDDLDTAQREAATLHFPMQSSIPPGRVVVTSEYPLSVRIGDRTVEVADRTEISVAPGNYDVTMEAPEYFLNETRRVVVASDAEVPLKVTSLVSVTIAATPSYCRVQVDGRDIGFVPTTIVIAVGEHDFSFDWERLGKTRTVRRRVTTGGERIFISADDGGAE